MKSIIDYAVGEIRECQVWMLLVNEWMKCEWALNWLNTDDVYLALNPQFIESIHVKKWMERLAKGKEKAVDQGPSMEEDIEVDFQKTLRETLKRSIVEVYQA